MVFAPWAAGSSLSFRGSDPRGIEYLFKHVPKLLELPLPQRKACSRQLLTPSGSVFNTKHAICLSSEPHVGRTLLSSLSQVRVGLLSPRSRVWHGSHWKLLLLPLRPGRLNLPSGPNAGMGL